jgi:hypothetical protein
MILVSIIYFVAMVRAIIQRNSEDLGISRGVKYFGLVSVLIIGGFMILWYVLFQEIAFFALTKP